jgi:hypothetical protein
MDGARQRFSRRRCFQQCQPATTCGRTRDLAKISSGIHYATQRRPGSGWLGMTVEQLEANYGHHHPDFQEEAAEAFGGRR